MTTDDSSLSDLEQKILKDLAKANLSDKERKILLHQLKVQDPTVKTYKHNFSNKSTRFLVISDTHIGHKDFKEPLLLKAFAAAKHYGVEAIYHVGDIVEGMNTRPGHVYELSHIGITPQIDYASQLLQMSPKPIYAITGNHDQWVWKNTGLDVGTALEAKVKDFTYLGMNEADIQLTDNVKMKLFHANDGTAYAQSYKLQKLIESLTGGQKPEILFEGHYHKALYSFIRNVHGFESGTLCGQTPWMRGKKIPAHMGFWLIDVTFNKNKRIDSLSPRFFPEYE